MGTPTPKTDTSKFTYGEWKKAGKPGGSYNDWWTSNTGRAAKSQALIDWETRQVETDAERIARKRSEVAPATPNAPDYADEVLMKAAGGTVQRLRKQGRASTFLSMDPWSGQ